MKVSGPLCALIGVTLTCVPAVKAEERIAFSTYDTEIFTIAPDGSDRRQVPGMRTNTRPDFRLAWSADGRWIAYTNGSELWRVRSDGSDARRVLTNHWGVSEPEFSPDGGRIVFTRDAPETECEDCPLVEGDPEIQSVRVDGTHLRRLRPGFAPTWSPDGREIAFVTLRQSIATMSPDGRDVRVIRRRSGAEDLHYSPDGTRLVSIRGLSAIEIVQVRSGVTYRWPRIAGLIDANWAPDGRRIGYLRASAIDAAKFTTSLFTATARGKERRRITTFREPQIAAAIAW
jgi:Tol biopolymer transport system component